MSWLPKKNVIVPIDFSDAAYAALDVALEIAESPDQVHIVHVLPDLSPVEPGVLWDVVSDESRIEHVKKSLSERLTDDKYAGVDAVVLVGQPGSQIADHAKKTGADLVVMPSHGRSVVARILLGSVADRVVRLAPCPVLIVRA